MQLVQWIIPFQAGGFAVVYAPASAQSVPAPTADGPSVLRYRRIAPLVSRWLPHPIAVGVDVAGDADAGAVGEGDVTVSFEFAVAAAGPPVLSMRDDAVAHSALFAELVGVLADLCEALTLPLLSITPARAALHVALGSLRTRNRAHVFDALCAFAVAVDSCVQARGFVCASAAVVVRHNGHTAHAPLDARLASVLPREQS